MIAIVEQRPRRGFSSGTSSAATDTDSTRSRGAAGGATGLAGARRKARSVPGLVADPSGDGSRGRPASSVAGTSGDGSRARPASSVADPSGDRSRGRTAGSVADPSGDRNRGRPAGSVAGTRGDGGRGRPAGLGQAGGRATIAGSSGDGRRSRAPGPGGRGDPVQRRRASGPAVVLRMPPPLDPPYDPPEPTPAGMDPLPLEWPGTPPPQPAPRARSARRAPPPPDPSNAYAAAQRFVSLCVEILNGYRPPSQLRPVSHPQRFPDISDQILRRTVRVRMAPGQAARQGRLVRARRLLLSEPSPGVSESVVVLEYGESTWAMAIRMEYTKRPGLGVLGWICTVIQVV